jgi:hypothetical protein
MDSLDRSIGLNVRHMLAVLVSAFDSFVLIKAYVDFSVWVSIGTISTDFILSLGISIFVGSVAVVSAVDKLINVA